MLQPANDQSQAENQTSDAALQIKTVTLFVCFLSFEDSLPDGKLAAVILSEVHTVSRRLQTSRPGAALLVVTKFPDVTLEHLAMALRCAMIAKNYSAHSVLVA